MKKIITTFLIFILSTSTASATVVEVSREKGYYVDGRGQVSEDTRIAPPNEHYVRPRPTKTVLPFEPYYDVNKLGLRRKYYMMDQIPNYNRYFSERRATPYTKQDYVDNWCTGDKNVKGVDCMSEHYAITFIRARNWSFGVIKAPIKAKKTSKKAAVFVMVDDLAVDASYMHDIKDWAELFNMPVFFGTIDALIPSNWII